MLERILLAAVVTFCIYLFLNLGGKSSNAPALDAQKKVVPGFLTPTSFLAW